MIKGTWYLGAGDNAEEKFGIEFFFEEAMSYEWILDNFPSLNNEEVFSVEDGYLKIKGQVVKAQRVVTQSYYPYIGTWYDGGYTQVAQPGTWRELKTYVIV